jgi:hypothetical protein
MPKRVDLIGQTFGWLTVKAKSPNTKKGRTLWLCECKCGNLVEVTTNDLKRDKKGKKSCGCMRSPDLTNKTFGKLKAIAKTDMRDSNYNVYWDCLCDCGGKKLATTTDLIKGNVTSCGCVATDKNIILGKKIGAYVRDNHCVDGTNVKNLTAKIRVDNTSGYKGVTYDKKRLKWCAQIRFKGKNYYLGRYAKIEQAVAARKSAENKIFGDFLDWYYSRYKKGGK